MILLAIAILLFFLYSILIIYFWQSWKQIPDFTAGPEIPKTRITVIIPSRNEEANIEKLLQALLQQSYPKELFEIIVIDDHSIDKTAEIIRQYSSSTIHLIQLQDDNINSYKKKAIEAGIREATGELIVSTDADCIPRSTWLQAIASFYEKKNAIFIAAPVSLDNNNSLLQIFQTLDFLTLQGITGSSVYKNFLNMCNGANLGYAKKAFYDVNGFSGIDHIASGDDMLLMEKIARIYPEKIHFLKSREAIVSTRPMITWKDFFNQRIRWASKAGKYKDKRIFPVLVLVYLFNLSFLILFIAGCWNYHYWIYLVCLWVAKSLVEYPFIKAVASFFDKRSLMKYFFLFQPVHILYTIIAGWLGQFGKYKWKGRWVR